MSTSVAIVGAGVTGTLLALHILRSASAPTAVCLVDRRSSYGRGVAYSSTVSSHLSNVRVGNMSAFPDEPSHFTDWLRRRNGAAAPAKLISASGHAFVPMWLYGTYLRDQLDLAVRGAAPGVSLSRVAADVVDLSTRRSGFALHLASGDLVTADSVALCMGNLPPRLPCAEPEPDLPHECLVRNPWDTGALARVPADAAVLIAGTSLIMIDVVLALLDAGHRAPIVAVSPCGLLPARHTEGRRYRDFLAGVPLPVRTAEVVRLVRREIERSAIEGYNCRSVVDALRPYTQRLWQGLGVEERRRFLRHVRPYWEVHRHRTAPGVAARIAAAQDGADLVVLAGRLRAVRRRDRRLWIDIRPRGRNADSSIVTDVLINCSEPECDLPRVDDPLIRALLRRGLIRPDPDHLGIDTTAHGDVFGADGIVVDGLFALGPSARGALWETTAVPELRSLCAAAALRLTGGSMAYGLACR